MKLEILWVNLMWQARNQPCSCSITLIHNNKLNELKYANAISKLVVLIFLFVFAGP